MKIKFILYKFQKNLIIKCFIYITEKDKSHYVFIKDFNRLIFSKTKHKDKKHFCMSCLQHFSAKEILNNHRKRCLLINGCEAVNYNKQIPILL